jgi:hypothetical protein
VSALLAEVPEAVQGVPADVLGELLVVMLQAESACWGKSSGISCELSRPGCLQLLLLLPKTRQLPSGVIIRLLGLPKQECCVEVLAKHLSKSATLTGN